MAETLSLSNPTLSTSVSHDQDTVSEKKTIVDISLQEFLYSQGYSTHNQKFIMAMMGRILAENYNLKADIWELGIIFKSTIENDIGINNLMKNLKQLNNTIWSDTITQDSTICPHEVQTMISRESTSSGSLQVPVVLHLKNYPSSWNLPSLAALERRFFIINLNNPIPKNLNIILPREELNKSYHDANNLFLSRHDDFWKFVV